MPDQGWSLRPQYFRYKAKEPQLPHILIAISGIGAYACLDEATFDPPGVDSYACETGTRLGLSEVKKAVEEVMSSVGVDLLSGIRLSAWFTDLVHDGPALVVDLLFC